ncbi:putative signal transducing protein [Planctomicrobium sp. SH661]|uniref:putative signal transducing protein n=1 Tax=Planctomicrobium sp. SH661 TaxID=3448124 RepID=UPI003F5C79CA
MKNSELREVHIARTVAEATLIAQALQAEGIRAQVVNATLQNAVGELPYLAVAPRVWVMAADSERASSLIRQHFQEQNAGGEVHQEWTCPRCDEENGSAFNFCWKCEFPRPGND